MINRIKNNPTTKRDVKIELEMLGRSKYEVEGKKVRRQPDTIITEPFPVPTSIFYYITPVLYVDVVHINQISFLVSLSKNVHYGVIKALDSIKILVIEDEIKRVNCMYDVRGFHVKYVLVDVQFKTIKDRGQFSVIVNVVAKGEHVLEIERFNRIIKERTK